MTNYFESKQLREQRAAAFAAGHACLAAKNVTPEVRATFDRYMKEVDSLGKKIDAVEGRVASQFPSIDFDQEFAFSRFVRHGQRNLSDLEKRSLERRDVAEGAPMLTHIGTYSGLGYLVPTGFTHAIDQATKYFCPLLTDGVCKVISTSTGQPLPFPVSDDTANAAVIVGEAASVQEEDITAYQVTSGVIKASIELLQDSAFDIEEWLTGRFGERWGRGLENFFTNGTGGGQPTGILTAITANGGPQTVATGSSESTGGAQTGANSIGYTDLVSLEHSIDPTYRMGARYMFHDTTLAAIKKILDKYGRPLWAAGIAVDEPDTINGYPYTINQSMPQIGSVSEAVTVVFGDFSKFVIRKVKDLYVQRLDELYANNGQVGFQSFARVDSNLVVASSAHPLGVLVQHS